MSLSPSPTEKLIGLDDFSSSPSDPGALDHWEDTESIGTRLKSFVKLSFILLSYGFSFRTMIQLGFLLADVSQFLDPKFMEEYKATGVLDWLMDIYESGRWLDQNILKALSNIALLVLFALQHTLMASRNLSKLTSFWYRVRHVYKIDKPIYTAMTGVALQVLMHFWQPIPVQIWTSDLVSYHNLFQWVHIISWTLLYGTSLMLDLPEMIGLNQVIIQSPTVTVKSPELQSMYQRQRHMGLVPFMFILLIHPYGSLDRFILTAGVVYYTCRQWKSETCYEYAQTMRKAKTYRLSY